MQTTSNKNFNLYIECDTLGSTDREIARQIARQLREIAEVLTVHGEPQKQREVTSPNGVRIGHYSLSVEGGWDGRAHVDARTFGEKAAAKNS